MTDERPPVVSSPIEAEVLRIRALLEHGEFSPALVAAENLLLQVPENRDLLYMKAVSLRYLKRLPEALATLQHFESIHPEYGRLHQERGHCLRAMGETSAAIASFERAVAFNAALPGSWTALQNLYAANNQHAAAKAAGDYAAQLARLPVPVITASSLLNEGNLQLAESVVRQFLKSNVRHVEAMRLLAQIGVRMEVLDDAEFLLESVLEFAPAYKIARYEYAMVLAKRHKFAEALGQADILLQAEPLNRAYRTLHATACVGLGRHNQALDTYRALIAEAPGSADVQLSIAHSLKTLGRQDEAIIAYQKAAAIRPDYGDAYWSLANLKTYRFSAAEIAQMRSIEAAATTKLVDRYHVCFALGKALEDEGLYAESFQQYEKGNALKRSEILPQMDSIERVMSAQTKVCTAEFFAKLRGLGCLDPSPIFIVGLPRSGSTLLEQILASHSQVEGTLELPDIPRLAHELNGRERDDAQRYPVVLESLKPEQLLELGRRYIRSTAVYRSGSAFFIDKMPNNFRHIGLIHAILPNAKIIDARREPMACCFSNFKQLFAAGQEFTYGIDDIARYYKAYVALMDHWDAVLPGKILRVQHEEVVADLEGNVRRLLDFCGLTFEHSCLEFHKTKRSIRTASSEQVRRPIFTEGLEQWRNFEPWLGPLKEALRPLLR